MMQIFTERYFYTDCNRRKKLFQNTSYTMATFFVTNKGQVCLLKEVNLRLFQEFGRKTVEW